MSTHTPEKLAYMANQIARNLALEADPALAVRAHIVAYWTPRMREIAAGMDVALLDPIARAALVGDA